MAGPWHSEIDEGVRQQSVRELLPKLIPLFKPHAAYLLTGVTLLAFITAAQLAGPRILRHIIDISMPAHDIPDLLLGAGLYVLVTVGGTYLGYLQSIALFNLGIRVITGLKDRLFEHVLRLGLEFHEQHPPGKLISRVESDTETLKELFSDVTVNLLRNGLLFIGSLGMIIYSSVVIGAWMLLLAAVLFAGALLFQRFMRRYWQAWRAQWAKVTGYVTEYVQGAEVIQQFNYQQRARERMHQVNLGKYRVELPSQFLDYAFWGVFILGATLAMIIVLVVGWRMVAAGAMTIGTIIMFFEYIRKMFEPIQQLTEQLNFVQRSMISVERVFGILETKPIVSDGPANRAELSFAREIAFENVWFAYEAENWILSDVSFTLRKGQKVAVVGASGGGKSTLVNLLLRFYDPQRGRITVDGRDIRDFPVDAWRGLIGLVLQDIYLFPGSVADNLRVFDISVPMERVKKVATVARADRVIAKLPGQYDGQLSERGGNLSVGERQLISFARALAYDPPLLVLDEATSSVDPHTERLVQEALDSLLEGRTALIVAHRLSTILNADQILVMHNGELAERGSHAELLAQAGLYARLFHLQFPTMDIEAGVKAAETASEKRSSEAVAVAAAEEQR